MKYYRGIFILIFLGYIHSCIGQVQLTDFVNPMIGTGGAGHTFPGATFPFGACQVSPDTRIDGSWEGCSGYHYSDSVVYGFSHTHLSGTGCSDYGDVLLMPILDDMPIDQYQYKKIFSHQNEIAKAGYYSLNFPNEKLNVELVSTLHGAIHQYTFPKEKKVKVVLNLAHRDLLLDSRVKQIDDYTLVGYRFSKAWAKNQKLFFVIKFNHKISKIRFENNFQINEKAKQILIYFENEKTETCGNLKLKVAISGVDENGALLNLSEEMKHWDMDSYKHFAKIEWNKELSKIYIDTKHKSQDTIFYTALYHSMIHPSLYSDVDGRYRGRDDIIHNTNGQFDYYTVFSLWDTYRALHPLLALIDKKRTLDFIQTFLHQYIEGGRLPMWELSSNETDCMIGYHAVSVIWDAYSKGIKNFDTKLALKAMIDIANENKYGKKNYINHKYLSVTDESESVSKTLEYSYDDWCIAQFAKSIGDSAVYYEFKNRSQNALNLYNWKTGFYEPKFNGNFFSNFKPNEVNNHFTEGNGWQYSRGNHDILNNFNSENIVVLKSDSIFNTSQKLIGREQADVTGLIGQYAHGNEPSHHLTFLIDEPVQKQKIIDHIVNEFYRNTPNGLVGNEDCGQMSAWYIWATLGLYPYKPGNGHYVMVKPQVNHAKIFVEPNECIEVNQVENFENQDSTKYKADLSHEDFMKYGYNFTNKIIKQKVIGADRKIDFDFMPIIDASSQTFRDSLLIKIEAITPQNIFYCINSPKHINEEIKPYRKPFYIYESSKIDFYKLDKQNQEDKIKFESTEYFKIDIDYQLTLKCKNNTQYYTDVVDGLYGNLSWRSGGWMGVQGEPFECHIDLKKSKHIKNIRGSFLQDQRSWIFYPSKIEVWVSNDNEKFTLLPIEHHTFLNEEETSSLQKFSVYCDRKIRYIKYKAYQYGVLPEWHPGAGGESFIFIDEIEID